MYLHTSINRGGNRLPNWSEILTEIQSLNAAGVTDANDAIRRKYIKELSDTTGRNTIAYYSGFLNNPSVHEASITDMDKNGFMTVINKLDRAKGLDLILHTPGGDLAAAESLVEYLRLMFGDDIRAIIPQMAMSAGTMIACSCKSIIMGKQSNIGPIDPQIRGIPASGVIEEFNRALLDVSSDPKSIPIWQVIIGKYHPTFIGECEKAIQWSSEIVHEWLKQNMLKDEHERDEIAKTIVEFLSNPNRTKAHARHIGIIDCERIGLNIKQLEKPIDGMNLQDAILSLHHAYMITLSSSSAIKVIENQNGVAMILNKNIPQPIPHQIIQMPTP